MLKRQIERYGKWLIAIGILMAVATAAGGYIVIKQHLKLPFEDSYKVRAEFEATSGFTPGLAQPVNVSGVRVGTITDAKLRDGRSMVTMEVDPGKLEHVYKDAHAVLVPNTALKDLQINISPGTPAAGVLDEEGFIPVARTTPPVDSDELTAALDADTRAFFVTLVGGVERGTRGRGRDLRELIKTLKPTSEQIDELGDVIVARRVQLRRLVHNLARLSRAAGAKDRELARLVTSANDTLGALASQETALRQSVARLPGTLSAARTSLRNVTSFAGELTPTLRRLTPTVRRLPAALRSLRPLVTEAEPMLRTKLRPFVRELQPLVRGRGATAKVLAKTAPVLTSLYRSLNYVANEAAYNPPGDNEGFLYWLAWFGHNGASFLSTEDANGAVWRGLAMMDCSQLNQLSPQLAPVLAAILGPLPTC
jgi:phospholipid/cholesterol/gamma-HCH transport system substrate-binding protein